MGILGGKIGPIVGGSGSYGAAETSLVTMIVHSFDFHHSKTGGIRQSGTGHPGEDDGGYNIHMPQGSPFTAYHSIGKAENHIRHFSAVHHLRHKYKQRYGNKNKLGIHICQELSCRHP